MSDILYRAELVPYTTGHQGSSQSGHHTNTGFGSFKLPTCYWLQKGWSHSHTESSWQVLLGPVERLGLNSPQASRVGMER